MSENPSIIELLAASRKLDDMLRPGAEKPPQSDTANAASGEENKEPDNGTGGIADKIAGGKSGTTKASPFAPRR